jgi:hypothetical protein
MMKRIAIILIASCMGGTILAYDLTIWNKTDGTVQVVVKYGWELVCPQSGPIEIESTQYFISSSQDRQEIRGYDESKAVTIQTRGNVCCPRVIEFKVLTGRAAGKWIEFYPTSTGAGISCKSSRIEVTNTNDWTNITAKKY